MTEFSGSSSRRQEMSHSITCDLCNALTAEAEKARAAGEAEQEQLIMLVLREHKKACHRGS
ncbi:MAG: hypothetical protein ABI348_09635 [Nitrososphaera sp.]|jgi:hypothetical protein